MSKHWFRTFLRIYFVSPGWVKKRTLGKVFLVAHDRGSHVILTAGEILVWKDGGPTYRLTSLTCCQFARSAND